MIQYIRDRFFDSLCILFPMEPLTFTVGLFIFEVRDTYVDSIDSIHQINFKWAVPIVDDSWLQNW